jgi:hypothetical protein
MPSHLITNPQLAQESDLCLKFLLLTLVGNLNLGPFSGKKFGGRKPAARHAENQGILACY